MGRNFDNIYRMQKRHEKERRRLQGMIRRGQQTTAALRDAVVLLDANGCLNWWNQAAETLLGLQPIDQGHPLVNLFDTQILLHTSMPASMKTHWICHRHAMRQAVAVPNQSFW